ncbi:MAG: hypothetical protein ACP5VE_10220 [Chthonomonadales bacterium]
MANDGRRAIRLICSCSGNAMGSILALAACFSVTPIKASTPAQTQHFLRSLRHSWCPYALPAETSLGEILQVARFDFDTVGISFVGPYNGGHMDFASLDQAIDAVSRRGQRVVLHLSPRFLEDEGVSDRLSDGTTLPNIWNRNPNYALADIFDPGQRRKICDWFRCVARRYGKDPRVAAFVLGWGNLGETGFFHGDFITNPASLGSVCAGYSTWALKAFNSWRRKHHLEPVTRLPLPSPIHQTQDYILFHRFRSEFIRTVFHKEILQAVKEFTSDPVGIFAYLPASPDSYARDWTDAPNADFYRTAGVAATYDMHRTLIDSGIGWEDAGLHDGTWNFTAACMERDEARQMARGGVYHMMWVREYRTDPRWEKNIQQKIARFLKTQRISERVRAERPVLALYQPTWGAAAIPGRSAQQPFLPKASVSTYVTKMVGLVESFGIPYQLVTERDLENPATLKPYRLVVVPLWDLLPRILGQEGAARLARDPRVIGIPTQDHPLTRSQMRALLRNRVPIRLDFDAEKILAGRTGNLVYNWDDHPIEVRVPEAREPLQLRPCEYRFIEAGPSLSPGRGS